MSSGFFGRLARKWWLMLVLGIVIGLAAGLPVGGKLLPGKQVGAAYNDIYIECSVGEYFTVIFSHPEGKLIDYEVNHLSTDTPSMMYANRPVTFKALSPTGSAPTFIKLLPDTGDEPVFWVTILP